jgi:D-alanyl-D-alanine carboxypeptidase
MARRKDGLPPSATAAHVGLHTTSWNMSQGGAAGGVISTVDDMHSFISAPLAGDLFRDPATLALMQEGVPAGDPGESA